MATVSYVPVMAAKRGEFRALEYLPAPVAERVFPLFELPTQKPGVTEVEKSISRTAAAAGKAWKGREAFLDISRWRPDARTESGLHVLEFTFGKFLSQGVQVNPVFGYDRRDDPAYRRALLNLREQHPMTPCLRFDREAIFDDMRDDDYFTEQVEEILEHLSLEPSSCYAMLDFGDASTIAVPDMIEAAERAVGLLRSMSIISVIIAGGSMPTTVNGAVGQPDSEGCLTRNEMLTWKAVVASLGDRAAIFGDYPIRNPDAPEGIVTQHANAKIRYTIANQFFVVRGHSKSLDSLAIQHRTLAEKLTSSHHYAGPEASWGDSELLQCALGLKELRDATCMIAIDTNRHIVAIIAEVFEHQTSTSVA